MVEPRAKYPTLYELNTRVRLNEFSVGLGRPATLDDMPSAELDRLAGLGFDWVWLLGVWQTGEVGRRISREVPQLHESYQQVLADLRQSDICGSPFAVVSYRVSEDLGGDEALARLRGRLAERGMRLVLDFVPNHTAIDHPWMEAHPEFYIRGSEQDIDRQPSNYLLIPGRGIFAHGRDPYFPGWTDTLQLNYGSDLLQEAMGRELVKIAGLCDGVRCDMAMLLTPEVFQRTWGIGMRPFWPETILQVRSAHPEFLFIAEVYWDLEWDLQQQGFDYTYDKRLYDRLRAGNAREVRSHLLAGLDFQQKSLRFLENHDEERSAAAFPPEMHRAAALITYSVPGMRFFHDGQLEGRRTRTSVHLCRRATEADDIALGTFYLKLLSYLKLPVFRTGDWEMLGSSPEACLAFCWSDEQSRALVVVNFSTDHSECRAWLGGDAGDLRFDLPGWGYKVLLLGPNS